MMRVNHEYQRGGALVWLAAYDVHHAGYSALRALTVHGAGEQVMTTEP